MKVLFVHGWSVTDTSTYGQLPEALAAQSGSVELELSIEHVWLGRYVSFHDEVTMTDVVRAFDRALRDTIPEGEGIAEFSCITHSTGGPVVREWIERFYGANRLKECPLRHLVMLAPANHGSALAALGKRRVGRIHAWWNGIEPGQRILDWLSLGSQEQHDLCAAFLGYEFLKGRFYPFVLTGQGIDHRFYDFINSYLAEEGSDGVVRVAGANLNYGMVRFVEGDGLAVIEHRGQELEMGRLEDPLVRRPSETVAIGVLPDTSHSGTSKGIMGAVRSPRSSRAQVGEILECLAVTGSTTYRRRVTQLAELTEETQDGGRLKHRFAMIVFSVVDDQGDPVTDYDLLLLGGDEHDPNRLSRGFFVDRQRNAAHPHRLVYYVDWGVIQENGWTGFRVIARPGEGEFGFYRPVQYSGPKLSEHLRANETLYVEVELRRRVDRNVFRLDPAGAPDAKDGVAAAGSSRGSFKRVRPSGQEVDE